MLTRLALRSRLITAGIMLVVMVAGAYSLSRLQIELLPDIDFPVVTVSAFYPNAGPQKVLDDVTVPIEQALEGIGQVTRVQTISAPSVSQVVVQTDFGEDMATLESEVNRRLRAASLPAGVTPRVARINPEEFPIIELAVVGDNDVAVLAGVVRQQVIPALEAVPGVLSVEVPLGLEEGDSIARANGRPAVTISIRKDPDANTVEVADGVNRKLEELGGNLPPGSAFMEISNQAPSIQASVDELTRHVLMGAVLAVAVMFAFLLSIRPTLVSAVAIPVSILAAFIVMRWQGMSLNILTLGGLAIAVGRVVDDSIVVMENTFRHIQKGELPRQAALNAAREVMVPITASTLTTIAVFAPLALIGGFISVIFLPFALTITYALLASLVVALTIVPVLAATFISRARAHRENVVERAYTGMVRWALAHRVRTLLIAGALVLASFLLVPFIPVSFLPSVGEPVLNVRMTVPAAADRASVLSELSDVETTLERMRTGGTVVAYSSTYGGSNLFTGVSSANAANLQVRLSDKVDSQAAAETLRATLPSADRQIIVSTVATGPDSSSLELILKGDDYATMARAANALAGRVRGLEGLVNVSSNAVDASSAPGLAALVPIVRVDGKQSVSITGTITAKNTQAVNLEIQRILDEDPLPPGITLVTGGVFADIQEAFSKMGIAMALGVLLVYAVMVVTQRSFVTPFVIVMSLPLALIGAMGGLFVTQRALGLPALMGLLMLVGLVVTNAIVLIAFVEQLRARGMGTYDALVTAGRTRLRPILMTALTTIFVLLPMALGIGGEGGGIIGAELATVVIGGLFASTFLTLVVIPVVYSYLRAKGPRVRGLPASERAAEAAATPAA